MCTREVPKVTNPFPPSEEVRDVYSELCGTTNKFIIALGETNEHQVRQAIHSACQERGIECKEPVE